MSERMSRPPSKFLQDTIALELTGQGIHSSPENKKASVRARAPRTTSLVYTLSFRSRIPSFVRAKGPAKGPVQRETEQKGRKRERRRKGRKKEKREISRN